MKKGVEIAMNTIVGAAIALLILVVVILIVTGQLGDVVRKFVGLREENTGGAGCLLAIPDPEKDRDGDGYIDKATYTVRVEKDGKRETKTCKCDIDSGTNRNTHKDTECK